MTRVLRCITFARIRKEIIDFGFRSWCVNCPTTNSMLYTMHCRFHGGGLRLRWYLYRERMMSKRVDFQIITKYSRLRAKHLIVKSKDTHKLLRLKSLISASIISTFFLIIKFSSKKIYFVSFTFFKENISQFFYALCSVDFSSSTEVRRVFSLIL